MKDFFCNFKNLIKSPVSFAEKINADENIRFFSVRFIPPLLLFLAASVMSALAMYFTPSDIYAYLTGVPLSVESSIGVVLAISITGSFFTSLFCSSLFCGFIAFLGKGKIALKLPIALILIPLLYITIFFMRLPPLVHVIIAVLAMAASFIPAFKDKKRFVSLLYCFFSFSAFMILFQALLMVSICLSMAKLYMLIQFAEMICTLIYIIAFCRGVSGLSSAKAFAAFLCSSVMLLAFMFALQISGLLTPEAMQILSLT